MFYVLAGLENMDVLCSGRSREHGCSMFWHVWRTWMFYVLAGLENMDVLCSGRNREHGCSMFWQV